MDLTEIVPPLAAVVALACFVAIIRSAGAPVRHWWLPALPLALFATWSAYAVVAEGPGGFWPEHVGGVWEVQIWMDLLLMACAVWWLVQPRLRATGSSPWPWAALVLATGSIGMLCLLLWVRRAEASTGPAAVRGPRLIPLASWGLDRPMASRLTEISLDCHDPDRLADFWTAVLDWVVLHREPGLVEIGPAGRDDRELLDAVRTGPVASTIFLAQVPEDKVAKNRVHFDVSPVDCSQDEEVARILALGASRADIGQSGDESWTVLADPEGNEFCVLRSLAPGHFSL